MAVEYEYPSADDSTQWDNSTGANHYTEIDEDQASPNDTDYVDDADSNSNDDFTTPFPTMTGASSVNNVTVHGRYKTDDTGDVRNLLYVNGTRYSATNAAPGAAFALDSFAWTTNPDTLAAWVIADVKGSGTNPIEKIGARSLLGAGETVHMSQMYWSVDYETDIEAEVYDKTKTVSDIKATATFNGTVEDITKTVSDILAGMTLSSAEINDITKTESYIEVNKILTLTLEDISKTTSALAADRLSTIALEDITKTTSDITGSVIYSSVVEDITKTVSDIIATTIFNMVVNDATKTVSSMIAGMTLGSAELASITKTISSIVAELIFSAVLDDITKTSSSAEVQLILNSALDDITKTSSSAEVALIFSAIVEDISKTDSEIIADLIEAVAAVGLGTIINPQIISETVLRTIRSRNT